MNRPMTAAPTGCRTRKHGFLEELARNRLLYLLALPAILFMIVFNYLPLAGLYIAFTEFNPMKGIFGSEFVGLLNFEFFFSGLDWPRVTWNTVYLNFLFIFAEISCSIILAIMLNEIAGKFFVRITQSVIILPYFVSWAIVGMLALTLFASDGGMINSILEFFGKEKISFYTTPEVWPPILVLIRIWKGAGYGTIIYLATMAGINSELYESARIDGATRFQMIRLITLPLLKNITVLMILLALGRVFYGDFGMIYALVGDNSFLFPTTDVIDTFVFRSLRSLGDFGMATAVGLYQSVVGFLLVVGANALIRVYDPEATVY
jgi:putative aldouronate transport system permease protein